jgi:hypothetical protein
VCMCGFCNVLVRVFMGFVMSCFFDNCVGILVICLLVFTVFSIVKLCFYCFV